MAKRVSHWFWQKTDSDAGFNYIELNSKMNAQLFSSGNAYLVSNNWCWHTEYFRRCYNTCVDEDFDQFGLMESLRRPSCDSLALALCDPMRRRSCEEDSLHDSCVDSGMSTLRSNNGYDYEHERTSCPSPVQAEDRNTTVSRDTSDTEVWYQ